MPHEFERDPNNPGRVLVPEFEVISCITTDQLRNYRYKPQKRERLVIDEFYKEEKMEDKRCDPNHIGPVPPAPKCDVEGCNNAAVSKSRFFTESGMAPANMDLNLCLVHLGAVAGDVAQCGMGVKQTSLRDRVRAIDGERFHDFSDATILKDECLNCHYFNDTVPVGQSYRCRCLPRCPGTVGEETKSYLLWKIGVIDEAKHMRNIGFKENSRLMILALVEHMKLLQNEVESMASLAHVHGWRSNNIERGNRTRAAINELHQKLYGTETSWVSLREAGDE